MPFLTDLDSRAAIKGSRDPLGVQPIWVRLGRHVVANLTTVSSSVRDFTVLLLGRHFAEVVAERRGADDDELPAFLKFEQLAGYARAHVNREVGFRGTERVWRRLNDCDRLPIGLGPDAQILSNQKIYGLWGLYTVPAKASGLLGGEASHLSPPARELVEKRLLPRVSAAGARIHEEIVERLRARSATLDTRERSRDAAIMKGVAGALATLGPLERETYREHLLHGGPADHDSARGTHGRQRLFAELLAETLDETDWTLTPESVRTLAGRAAKRGGAGADLAHRLERIRAAESVLAPAVAFYEYLLGCDARRPEEVVDDFRRHWGDALAHTIETDAVEALEPELRAAGDDPESGRRWVRIADALHSARYGEAIPLVMEQNSAVMRARAAAAPWAEIRDGRIQVRFRDERPGRLPEAAELPNYWRHAYFIESLRTVAGALRTER